MAEKIEVQAVRIKPDGPWLLCVYGEILASLLKNGFEEHELEIETRSMTEKELYQLPDVSEAPLA